jgi:hypothetical protein
MHAPAQIPPRLDAATLRYVIERLEHDLRELDRRVGRCALCREAELVRFAGELRGLARQASSR